jgi:uncharacterized protein (TIGR00255 family)
MLKSSLKSMTAYAVIEKSYGTKTYKIHLKTVNHRFTELKCRMPRSWMAFEIETKQFLQKSLERGSFDLWVEENTPALKTNRQTKVKNLFEKLNLAMGEIEGISQLSVPNPMRALILSRFPDLWMEEEAIDKEETVTSAEFMKWIAELSAHVDLARSKEGALTQKALIHYVDEIARRRTEIESQYPKLKADWEKAYKERLTKAAEDLKVASIPEERLLQEILVLGEKRDVAEELQRASGHIAHLKDYLENPGQENAGKKIEFFLQELHREWTTLGNKIQNLEIAKSVIEAKLCLEKIREQSLNLV